MNTYSAATRAGQAPAHRLTLPQAAAKITSARRKVDAALVHLTDAEAIGARGNGNALCTVAEAAGRALADASALLAEIQAARESLRNPQT